MHKSVLSLVCCLFFFLSCQEEIETMPNGSLNIVLTDGVAVTRTLPDALSDELRQQFTIELLRDRDGTIVPEYKGALKDFGDQRVFKVGSYQLKAYLGENPALELDAPYYYGEVQDIAIEKGKATTVSVGCKVANALATFEIVNREAFDKRLKDYYVEVTVGSESVTWKPGDVTHPYFKAGGRVTMALIGTSVETGQEGSYALNPIETVKAGVKYNYKLSMKASNVGFEVTTEARQEPVTINETVPDSWLPKAKVFSEDFDENHVLTYTETADALSRAGVSYTALRPVQDVEFALNFADKHLEHLNKTYLLSELSEEDRRALAAVNIVLPDLAAGSTEGVIDFAGVTPGMLTHDGGQDTDNIIAVRVKANDRWSDAGMYTIRTVKPIFKVDVRKGNIWSKEFTIDECEVIAGNESKIKSDLKYQYSVDGINWIDCELTTKFDNYQKDKEFQVRALYRGDISTDIVYFSLENSMQLPNSGLEEWNHTSLIKDKSIIYYPYGAGETAFWNTNNEFTTRYRNNTMGKPYNCFPAVSYTKDAHGGVYAAELRNSAAGRGNTWFIGHTELDMNKVPGELFIGDVTIETGGTDASPKGDHYTIIKGKEFSSRPTAFSFWYKYAPLNSDTWKVYVALYDENRDLIIENTCTSSIEQNDFVQYTVPLNYDEKTYYNPCKYICVIFSSTISLGSNLPYQTKTVSLWVGDTQKGFKDTFAGSTLIIDDISLHYDK